MPGFRRRLPTVLLPPLAAIAIALSGAPVAMAQTDPVQAAAEAIPSMPVARLAGALARPDSGPAVDRYLRGDGASPDVVARRAAALIRKLGTGRGALRPETLLRAVDRVTYEATRSLSFSPVMRFAIADDFRAQNAALAWDFGPKAGQVMAGFERVDPSDKRLAGVGVAALRKDNGNPLLTDGIAGLRKIELPLADGDYRIILMTQNFGVGSLTGTPFGREVRVNGVSVIVQRNGPSSWANAALLTQGGVRAAGTGYRRMGGYLAGDIGDEANALYVRQEGGALIVEGHAAGGRLVIELRGFDNSQSYLTGIVAEPLDRPSDLVLSESVVRSVIPQTVRLALEADIMLAASEVVQDIAPAAGQAVESADVVTAN